MSLQDLTPEQLNTLANAHSKSEFRRLSIMMDQDPIETEELIEDNTPKTDNNQESESLREPIVAETITIGRIMNKSCSAPLNVRSGPGFEFPVIRTITDETPYEITKEENGFGKIGDTTEWVCLKFLKEI